MNKPVPQVIEVEVKPASPARSPPVAKRLLKARLQQEQEISLHDIELKLKKAENLRQQELSKKVKNLTDQRLI